MREESKFDVRKKEMFHQITELITKYGYEKITIRGLCKEMGISTGTFYHYFRDKGDLLEVLFSDIDQYFVEAVAEKFTEFEPDNLVYYFVSYGHYIVRNGVETCRAISIGPLETRGKEYFSENRSIAEILRKILIRGMEKGQFRDSLDPEDTTRMLLVMMRGYSQDWAKHNGSYDIVQELEKFGKFVREPLLAPTVQ